MKGCGGKDRGGSPLMTNKTMTLRLPAEQAAELEAVARVEETSVSHAVRDAINESIARRRADPEFRERLRRIYDRDREVFERLAK